MFKSYEMYAFELSSDFNVMKFLALLKFFFFYYGSCFWWR